MPAWVSRTGYSGELGYEIFCSPEHAEQLWAAVVGAGARPYGLAAVETLRIESGLIFIGYDYFQHETSPFDMSLDKVIRLDTGDFHGKAALAETAEGAAAPARHTRARGRRRSRVRRGGDEGRRAGGYADEPVREPDARQGDRDGRARERLAAPVTRVEVALGDGNVAATVGHTADLRPRQGAAPRVGRTTRP